MRNTLVAEYSSLNSSVVLSQIPMSELNLKGTLMSPSIINTEDDITTSTDSNSGPYARMTLKNT